MKAFAAATLFLTLAAFAGVFSAGCADQSRPTNSAQNQLAAAPDPGAASSPGAAAKDGGGGGW
jgi:hypothetical protein